MIFTVGGWVLVAVQALFLLHILWRLIACGNGVIHSLFAASYFVLALTFRLSQPDVTLMPVWLPLIYSYGWLAITAALWAAISMRVNRRGIFFPGQPPLATALLASQLTLHISILVSFSWLGWQVISTYVFVPPLIAITSYLNYLLLRKLIKTEHQNQLSWPGLLTIIVVVPTIMVFAAKWVTPIMLGWM